MIPSAGYKTLRKTLCKTTIPVLGPNHLSTDVTIWGKPDGAGVKGENYLRMHFYLPTDYMVPDPDVINKYDYDGKKLKKALRVSSRWRFFKKKSNSIYV
jgi:hypothetical protein